MTAEVAQEQSSISKSSHGSWSPGVVDSFSLDAGEVESCKSQLLSQVPRRSRVDIEKYLKLPSNEALLSERWKQRESINTGGLLICYSGSVGEFLFWKIVAIDPILGALVISTHLCQFSLSANFWDFVFRLRSRLFRFTCLGGDILQQLCIVSALSCCTKYCRY